jgi:hypothetical protein
MRLHGTHGGKTGGRGGGGGRGAGEGTGEGAEGRTGGVVEARGVLLAVEREERGGWRGGEQ